jgi:hypothetical protein
MAHPDQRPLWRYYLTEVLDHWQYVLFGIVIGGGTIWWLTRPHLTDDALAATACRQFYSQANSSVDTLRVDALYPLGPSGKDVMTCGRMRALSLLD